MDMPTDAEVEAGARAMCLQNDVDPDGCAFGSGFFRTDGTSGFTCHRKNWETRKADVYAALAAIGALRKSTPVT